MAIRIGEQTVTERMNAAKVEVRRLKAEHDAAMRRYNDFRDSVQHLARTPEIDNQEEKLLNECQQLWTALDEANDLLRWMKWNCDAHRKER